MKLILSLLILVVASFTCTSLAGDIKKGDTATVPDWQWVDVKNDAPVTQHFSNTTHQLSYGDTCGIEEGGQVKVVGINGARVLVQYTAPGSPLGTPCPTGVVFFLEKKEFSEMTAKYRATRAKKAEEQATVRYLMTGKH